ncbi:MAG: 5-bromo-4-chloroindolyl phosphate hydrolysis family protein [Oscillospiraceae bacterium]|nr:5-bromo-4-chloroindolyl phosphate hydrolysis family protein [Oscillospiraceae bacterium]
MKKIKRMSPFPFLIAGAVGLLYGVTQRIASPRQYISLLFLAFLVFWVSKIFFKNRIIEIELAPDTGDDTANSLITETRDAIKKVRAANDAIPDERVSATIESIENSARELLHRIETSPALASQLRTFMRYYLPTTVKILDARAAMEPGKGGASVSREAMQTRDRTERMLTLIDEAFRNQLAALEKNRYLDVQVEMDVLEGMLKSNGIVQ